MDAHTAETHLRSLLESPEPLFLGQVLPCTSPAEKVRFLEAVAGWAELHLSINISQRYLPTDTASRIYASEGRDTISSPSRLVDRYQHWVLTHTAFDSLDCSGIYALATEYSLEVFQETVAASLEETVGLLRLHAVDPLEGYIASMLGMRSPDGVVYGHKRGGQAWMWVHVECEGLGFRVWMNPVSLEVEIEIMVRYVETPLLMPVELVDE